MNPPPPATRTSTLLTSGPFPLESVDSILVFPGAMPNDPGALESRYFGEGLSSA
jgi:hypothetical protein